MTSTRIDDEHENASRLAKLDAVRFHDERGMNDGNGVGIARFISKQLRPTQWTISFTEQDYARFYVFYDALAVKHVAALQFDGSMIYILQTDCTFHF